MSEPIAITVKRWKCPHCGRNHSSKTRARAHMARCWENPEAKGCKTCKHFVDADLGEPEVGISYTPEACDLEQSLAGRDACERCHGANYVYTGEIFRPRFAAPGRVMDRCPECCGAGAAVKPGPIVHCPLWELSPDFEPASQKG